jgi:REP element-mobilizing transposase RayT
MQPMSLPPTHKANPHRLQKGWNERGYLPHFDADTLIQFITFRLADSLPKAIFDTLRAEVSDNADLRKKIEGAVDSGLGSCALRDPAIAMMVQDALRHFDGERYLLLAWTIMPNHVHVLARQIAGWPLADIIHGWKSFTAKRANKQLCGRGPFWEPDYFDRFIRNQTHFDAVLHYIQENPVEAGLVERADQWPWSSAYRSAGIPPAL